MAASCCIDGALCQDPLFWRGIGFGGPLYGAWHTTSLSSAQCAANFSSYVSPAGELCALQPEACCSGLCADCTPLATPEPAECFQMADGAVYRGAINRGKSGALCADGNRLTPP